MECKVAVLMLAVAALSAMCSAKPYHQKKGHSRFHAKVLRQDFADTGTLDEPQGRLGDSDRWMSWEPKAPLAVPDNNGDSTEEEVEETEETSDSDTQEVVTPELDRKVPRTRLDEDKGGEEDDDAMDNNSFDDVSKDESKVPLREGTSIRHVHLSRHSEDNSAQEHSSHDEVTSESDRKSSSQSDEQQRESSSISESSAHSNQQIRIKTGKHFGEINSTTTKPELTGSPESVLPKATVLASSEKPADNFFTAMKNVNEIEKFPASDECASKYCHYGRVCEKGVCVCAPSDYCRGHMKAVCGTDGVTYPSHCELHRMACVNSRHIGIDHTGKKCLLSTTGKTESKAVETFVFDDLSLQNDEPNAITKKAQLQNTDNRVENNLFQEDRFEQEVDVSHAHMEQSARRACTELEYEQLKTILMQYHCARIGETDCSEKSSRKQFVANIMFNYYDRNNNEALDESELKDVEHRDHLEKLSRFCGLADMLTFDDHQEDGNISLAEFYSAFDVPTVLLDDDLKVFTTRVTAGNSVELKCDIRGAVELVWKRNGGLLDDTTAPELKTFDDGSLYISNIGLHHMGNYTCQDRYSDHVIQTHILHVQLAPRVRVSPSTQFHTSGSSVTLKCHADGVPQPEMVWEMNEAPLVEDETSQHYMRLHNNATLEIRQAIYTKDTGAYKCKARNSAGTGQDIATVFIENSNVPKYYASEDLYEVFLVFHDKGYTAYEPGHCHIEHQVTGGFSMFKMLPDFGTTLPSLCPEDNICSWGDAVNVRNKFIYISQPKLNRVVVIEIQDRSNPIEIIPMDKVPVQVHYIEHLDQIWVLCWNDESETGSKTIVVVRQASEDIQHHTVHTQPIANKFDLVRDMFLPPNNDLQHHFSYGYVVHMEQRGLYKLDLATMKYTKNVDLTAYNCIPKSVAFVAMGGQVVVHCVNPTDENRKSWQLILDYVTDAVLSETQVTGDAYVSPDGRYVVVVDDQGDMITVNKVLDDGTMTKVDDEYTNLHIAGVTFFPSERGRSYDFYASSINKNVVLYKNLASGRVEMVEGVGQAIKPQEWKWSRDNRVIVSGGVFGEYLMTPSRDSIVVIDGRRRHVQCEWQDITHGNIIVWVEPMHL